MLLSARRTNWSQSVQAPKPTVPQLHHLRAADAAHSVEGNAVLRKAWEVAELSRPETCHNRNKHASSGNKLYATALIWGGGPPSPKRGSSNALGPLGQARALDVPCRCCRSRCDLSFEAKQIGKKGATASGDPETMPCVASWVEARLRHSPLALWTLDTGR
jgi:hypothetical protein